MKTRPSVFRLSRFKPVSQIVVVSVVASLASPRIETSCHGAQQNEALIATLPDSPAAAWQKVSKVHQALRPPAHWHAREPGPEVIAEFQARVRQEAVKFAAKAKEFIKRFPDDENAAALRRFRDEKEMSWPQHFDGKSFGNRFATQFGIFAIPTVWLVDKHGNLRDTNARAPDLEDRIEKLLN